MSRYSDPQGRFSFDIPPGWGATVGQSGARFAVVLSPPPPLTGQMTIETYATQNESLETLKSVDVSSMAINAPNLKESPAGITPFAVGDKEAYRWQLVGPFNNQLTVVDRYLVMVGADAYIIAFAFNAESSAAVSGAENIVISSFKFSQ